MLCVLMIVIVILQAQVSERKLEDKRWGGPRHSCSRVGGYEREGEGTRRDALGYAQRRWTVHGGGYAGHRRTEGI